MNEKNIPAGMPHEHQGDRPLPLDSDIEVSETRDGSPRLLHLRWSDIGLVFVGGSLGTASRYLLTEIIPDWLGLPVGTAAINILGAFALGVLLEALARGGPDARGRRMLRLLAGTGFLGGFTTYSALASGTDALISGNAAWGAVLYAAVSIVIGACASAAGILLAAGHHRRWQPRRYSLPSTPIDGDGS
jgi:CrcB protein